MLRGKTKWRDTGRRWPCTNQEERSGTDSPFQPSEGTHPATPWSWTSSLQNHEPVSFCCLGSQSVGLSSSSLRKRIHVGKQRDKERQDNLFLFFYKFIYFIYLLFLAALGLRCYSTLRCMGFSLQCLLLLRSMGSRHTGFSSCGTLAQ